MASDQVNSSLPGSLNMHLNDTEHELGDTTVVEIKKASHVVYCSDGAVELFDDDTDVKEVKLVSESNLAVVHYLPSSVVHAGQRALAAADYLGEKLAYWFGITSPKFQYEIDEFNRMKKEEADRVAREKAEFAGWNNVCKEDQITVVSEKNELEDSGSSDPVQEESTLLKQVKF